MKGKRVSSSRIQRKASKRTRTPKPASNTPQHQLLDLQQAAGNQAVGRLIQAKLATEGGGEPLPEATRAYFEPRLGHDFGDVRVHTDNRAAESAQAIGAIAFTTGQDIVFGPGQYEPSTPKGKRLLAHELTHVVQQAGDTQGNLPDIQRATPTEAPGAAPPQTKREIARNTADFLRGQREIFVRQVNRPVEELLKSLRTITENGLALIAGDPDPDAVTIVNDLRNTYHYAVREVLQSRTRAQPGAVHAPPTLQELYEKHRDDILPVGLPNANIDAAANELTAEFDAPLPDRPTPQQRARHKAIVAARQKLRVSTAKVEMGLKDLFSTAGATTTIQLPKDTSTRFSSTVPATLQRGLSNVAATLAQDSLAANTTVMLALDLTPFGGGYDAYRFTRIDLGAQGGEILIERQGAIGIEGLRAEQREQLQKQFDGFKFTRSGFNQEEFDQVLIGLSEIPEAHLRSLGPLKFERVKGPHPEKDQKDAAGAYDQKTHTVRIFDPAFSGGIARMGRAGRVLTFAAYSVIHEVGHAHDLAALRVTAAATVAAEKALLAEFGTGGREFSIPDRRSPDRARFDPLNNALTAAQQAEARARSLSGARWAREAGKDAEITDTLADGNQPAFRQAALRDGGPAGRQMPTNYPKPQSVWQEYFAESFALYQSSPELLRRIRPNVYRFMEQHFPR